MDYTEKLGEFIWKCSYGEFPPELIRRTKALIKDLVGCVIGGYSASVSKIVLDYIGDMGTAGVCSLWGRTERVDPLNAAMANAFCGHILEMDDLHTAGCQHPGVTVIPAAVALCEKEHLSGIQLIEAVAAGYETEIRVGEALGDSHYLIWHTTGTAGCFGAAAACAKLYGMSVDRIADALGNAGTQAAGLWQFVEENALSGLLHCAKANMNGMIAANLSRLGLSGAHAILEGKKGLLAGACGGDRPDRAFASLGAGWKIMEAELKPWPCCRHTQTAVECCIGFHNSGVDYHKITSVTMETYLLATQVAKNNDEIPNLAAARFSIVYCAAIALIFGCVTIQNMEENLDNPEVRALCKKMHIITTDEMERLRPGYMPMRVTVVCGGRIYTDERKLAKGNKDHFLTDREIDEKFNSLAGMSIGPERASVISERLNRLEEIDDLRTLFE